MPGLNAISTTPWLPMSAWSPGDIDWHRFDGTKVDADLLKLVKAASMVERNAPQYATYLCNVFHEDAWLKPLIQKWADSEVQHGNMLARWARLADPDFDFDTRFRRFRGGFCVPTELTESVRGSLTGELLARCVVETGTSSYYTAIRRATSEPVLKELCGFIAADELRHYKTFYDLSKRYLEKEKVGLTDRLRVVVGRVVETEDDELAYAYHSANDDHVSFNHDRSSHAYVSRAYRLYSIDLVERVCAMLLKVVGLRPRGRLASLMARFVHMFMQWRSKRYSMKRY